MAAVIAEAVGSTGRAIGAKVPPVAVGRLLVGATLDPERGRRPIPEVIAGFVHPRG